MPSEIRAIYQQNVGIAVVVVINEREAWAHGFRQPFFSEAAVVMTEVNSCLFVMSRKWIVGHGSLPVAKPIDTEHRDQKEVFREAHINREAPADTMVEASRALPGAVSTWYFVSAGADRHVQHSLPLIVVFRSDWR